MHQNPSGLTLSRWQEKAGSHVDRPQRNLVVLMFPVAAELAPVMTAAIIVVKEVEGEKWSPKAKTGVSIAVIIVIATGTTMPVRAQTPAPALATVPTMHLLHQTFTGLRDSSVT
jgi:hypothetical protein